MIGRRSVAALARNRLGRSLLGLSLLVTITTVLRADDADPTATVPAASAAPHSVAIQPAPAGQAARAVPSTTVPAEHAARMAKSLELFRTQVKTILMERCVGCHGQDSVESEFSLATRADLLRGGASGPAVVLNAQKQLQLGKAIDSPLYRLIAHSEKPFMPFEDDKLSSKEIAAMVAWLDHGAAYDGPLVENPLEARSWTETVIDDEARDFWSFRPFNQVRPPDVTNEARSRNSLDRYVQAKLEEERLIPNDEMSRRQLIRRASFDLLGLPPSPEAIEEFVNDPAPDVYSRLLDRLLSSPHYGERWGRHWLDLARFAESHGFEHDTDRKSAYHYRDFVIRALNDDLPYNTFVKWQLAGDEFDPDENLALMATGFLAAGVHSTQITKNEVEKHRYDELDDIIATTGTAMLGLTIGCARCHDHKYDPIPQADYYRLLSAFTTTVRSEVDLNMDRERYQKAKAAFDREHAPLVAVVDAFEKEQLPERMREWEETRSPKDAPKWIVPDFVETKAAGGATFETQDDGSLLVGGPNEKLERFTFTTQTQLTGITKIRLDAMADPSLPGGGPGRGDKGSFALSELSVTITPTNQESASPTKTVLRNATATTALKQRPVKAAIDGKEKSFWKIDTAAGTSAAAMFETAALIGFEGGTTITFVLSFRHKPGQTIGRPRISLSGDSDAHLEDATMTERVVDVLRVRPDQRTDGQTANLQRWYRHIEPEWLLRNAVVEEHWQQRPRPELVKALISSEGLDAVRLHTQGGDFLDDTHFLRRGDPNQKQGVAPLGYLQVLMKTSDDSARWNTEPPEGSRTSFRRTSLANWITDTDQGAGRLLARVIANRLWQHHMGQGIVSTPSDFGLRGQPPSHPELLDALATELIRREWRLKPIHKMMMMTATYRQSSKSNAANLARDDANAFFWRHERRRLEGEVIRDALLTVGDRLDDRMLGPGTLNESSRRRSIYFTVKRSQLVSMMQVFDAPDALSGIGQRPSTTNAPQALLLMNNAGTRDGAKNFARRLIDLSEQSLEQAVRKAYLTAIGRQPAEAELREAVAFIDQQRESYRADNNPKGPELALADFCQVLMCLNEFVYVE